MSSEQAQESPRHEIARWAAIGMLERGLAAADAAAKAAERVDAVRQEAFREAEATLLRAADAYRPNTARHQHYREAAEYVRRLGLGEQR